LNTKRRSGRGDGASQQADAEECVTHG
jgi:hypothetical protein